MTRENAPFAARLVRAPIPFDADAGNDLARGFGDLSPELRSLLAGTGGCSPFLKALSEREGDWLRQALSVAPETAFADILAALPRAAAPAQTATALRRAKGRVALLVALADLGGVWSLQEVTAALTDFADAAVNRALACHLLPEIRRGKLPGFDPADSEAASETGAGMVALAMGKMGAHELNYSSDIDLICLFDETRFDPADMMEARAVFIRATRKAAATLSDHTAEGYVFRTDLRLRPDASVTPVCISMEAAERYYESLGRTWERAAYIKARPAAGDLAAGMRFLGILRPFVWRKHLDFAAIQDAHDMRLRIRSHKGLGGALMLDGHDMKLGQGGIREIEFFTQTRQLIAGGRDPDLRARDTVGGLRALAAKGWIPAEVAESLVAHYRENREIEHRLQMVQDAQTQRLPTSPEGFDRLARFMGEGDTTRFRARLTERLKEVAHLTEDFFAPAGASGETLAEARPALREAQERIVEGWRAYPALRSARGRELFRRLEPEILTRLQAAANPDEALISFDRFLSGLPAGVQLFALFDANPTLIDLLLDICATAPRLADHLSRNAGVFDAVIGGDFFSPWPGAAALSADLSAVMAPIDDYERRLDAARRWAREWHFRIGVHHLRGLIDGFEAATQYAHLADAVLDALWPVVVDEFADKHGQPPGRGAVVLGMGSLGAGRLNAGSDLDLIMIYDAAGQEASQGRRPLAARPYYARLTQALVTALSAPMPAGRLYEVDMRLRPSGRQGPVATALESFRGYQRSEAWTWEHLALTRARPVAGVSELADEVEVFRRALLAEKATGSSIAQDVANMRARLQAARPGGAGFDARAGAGRLQDIELVAQMGALMAASPARRTEAQLLAARRAGVIDAAQEETLVRSYRLLWRLHAAMRLLGQGGGGDAATLPGQGATSFVLRETGEADEAALQARLAAGAQAAEAVIAALLPAVSDGGA